MHNSIVERLADVLRHLEAGSRDDRLRLRDRLLALSTSYAEDYGGDELSVRSVRALLGYLEGHPSLPYPDLTATPDGDIYAEWRGVRDAKLAIEFLDSGEARFLLLWRNPVHPSRMDQLSGCTTADALGSAMRPLAQLSGLAA